MLIMSQVIRKLQQGDKVTKTNSEKLFKDGNREVSLDVLQRGASKNLTQYLESRNWSRKKQQAFMDAYQDMMQSIDNGTISQRDVSRRYVDSSGKLANSSTKGFDSYGEAAHYLDTILDIVPDYKKQEPTKKKYNQEGLLTLFRNKFFGGAEPDAMIWQGRDQKNSDGKYNTVNRARDFANMLDEYAQDIKDNDYDYSGSAYTDSNDLLTRLSAATEALRNNTFDSNDYSTLASLGLNGDLIKTLFSSDSLQPTQEQQAPVTEADKARKRLEEIQQEQEDQKAIDQVAEYDRQESIKRILTQKWFEPFKNFQKQYLQLPVANYDKAGWSKAVKLRNPDVYYNNFAKLFSTRDPLQNRNWKIPALSKGQPDTPYLQYLSNNLDYLNTIGMLEDAGGDYEGYKYFPETLDQDTGTVVLYNPTTRMYLREAAYRIPNLRAKLIEQYNTQNDNPFMKNGGVLKFQFGGRSFNTANDSYINTVRKQQKIQQVKDLKKKQSEAQKEGRTLKQKQAGERLPVEGWTGVDYARLTGIGLDIASAISALAPGAGTVVSGVTGVGSTLTNLGADIADDSVSAWDTGKNFLFGLGMDAVGLIPGYGAAGKGAKIGKILINYVPKLIAGLAALDAFNNKDKILGSLNKFKDEGVDKLTVDDWRNIATAIGIATGAVRIGTTAAKTSAYKQASKAGPKTTKTLIRVGSGEAKPISTTDLAKLKKARNLEEANKTLKTIKGFENDYLDYSFKRGKNPFKSEFWHKPNVSTRTTQDYNFNFTKANGKKFGSNADERLYMWSVNSGISTPKILKIKNPYTVTKLETKPTKQNTKQNTEQTTEKQNIIQYLRSMNPEKNLSKSDIKMINKLRGMQGKQPLTEDQVASLRNRRWNRMDDQYADKIRQEKRQQKLYELRNKKTQQKKEQEQKEQRKQEEYQEAIKQQKQEQSIREEELKSYIESLLSHKAPRADEIPKVRRPLAGSAYESRRKTYTKLWPELHITTKPSNPKAYIYQPPKKNSNNKHDKLQKQYDELFKDFTVSEQSIKVPTAKSYKSVPTEKSEKGKLRAARKQKAKEEAKAKKARDNEAYISSRKLKKLNNSVQSKKRKKKTTKNNTGYYRRQLGGVLRILKAQQGVKVSQEFMNSPFITGPVTASEIAGKPNTRGKVSRANTYSFDTVSRLNSMLDLIAKGKATVDDVNMMQRRHAGMYAGYNPEFSPIYNEKVRDYQTDYQSWGLNDLIIGPNYNKNYLIKSKLPNSGDSATSSWKSDGYYDSITDDRRVLARKEDYMVNGVLDQDKLNKDIALAKQNGFDYYLDPDTNYYMLRKLPAQAAATSTADKSSAQKSVNNSSYVTGRQGKPGTDWGGVVSKYLPDFLQAGRLAGDIANNNRVTEEVKKGLRPLLLDTYDIHKYLEGDFGTRQNYYRYASNLEKLAAKPFTSDASLQLAGRLEARQKGNELRTQGDYVDNQAIRESRNQAWQVEANNQARRSDVANRNRQSIIGINKAKHDIEAARQSTNWTNIQTFLKNLEYEQKVKQQQQQQFDLAVAKQNIEDPSQNARLQELYSILSSQPENVDITTLPEYAELMQLRKQMQRDQVDQYNNIYSKIYGLRYKPVIRYTPTLKNGGTVEAAKIKAKTQTAKMFQDNIKESVKNNIKMINNLSSVTKQLILKSMTL